MDSPWDRRLGFWWIAEDQPDAPAILESPDGPRTYGELAGDAHQLVHLFRSLGHRRRRRGRACWSTTATRSSRRRSPATRPGSIHPAQHPPDGRTSWTTIMDHSGAKVLVVGERFARLLDGSTAAARRCGAGGRRVDGVQSLADGPRASIRASTPDGSPARRPVRLHVGHHRQAEGHPPADPDGRRRPGRQRHRRCSAGRSTSARSTGRCSCRTGDVPRRLAQLLHGRRCNVGHALVIMVASSTPRSAAADRAATASAAATWCRPSSTASSSCPHDVRARYDLSSLHSIVHSAAPCPRRVKEEMMAWWGPVIWETYGGMEGAATIAKPHRWLEKPGTVGRADPRRAPAHPRRRRQRAAARRGRPHLHGQRRRVHATTTTPTQTDRGVHGASVQPRRHRPPRRRRLPVHLRPRQGHDHHRRHERLPGRDRGGAARPSRRRRRRP